MYGIFTKTFDSNNSVIHPPGFDIIKRSYQRDVIHIVNYFNNRVFSINNRHLLSRIINSASTNLEYDLDRYMEVIYARAPYISRLYNLTSNISYGKLEDGAFYGPGNIELLLSVENYFNPYTEISRWKSIQAVKVLDHPISDMGLLLPDGNSKDVEKGFACISIDIPLLMLQYRGFCFDQKLKTGLASESLLSINHFVKMYVLPGMIESHLQIVTMNRLMNLFYGAPMGRALFKYQFPIVHYENRLDKVLEDVLKHIKESRMSYNTYLKCIPSFMEEDMQASLIMPDLAKTRQVWWGLYLARLKYIKFLIDVGGTEGIGYNGTYINRMKVDIKRLLDENVFSTVIDNREYRDKVLKDLTDLLNIKD